MSNLPSGFIGYPEDPEYEMAFMRDKAERERDHARTALVAIQEMHKPVLPVFNWALGMRLQEPCPDCHGKAGVHECGCWADDDTKFVCADCSDFDEGKGRRVIFPCDTRKLADEGLAGSQ